MDQIRRLKIRHLETFVEVARHKSVSRAAQSLHVTQPAVTRTLRELEEICGAKLFARDGRGIRLTSRAELFLRHAGASLASARSGLFALRELNAAASPPVRIGALPTVSATIIPRAVALFLDGGAASRLRITTGENRVLLDDLRAGELDLVVGRLPAPQNMTGLSFEPLYRDKVVFAVNASHPLAARGAIAASELSQWTLLVPQPGSIIRPLVEHLFLEQGIADPPSVVETVSDSFGRAFLRQQPAIWIISSGVVADEMATGEFVALPINTDTTLGAVGVNTRSGIALAPAATVFVDILRRVAAGSGAIAA